MKIGINGFGRIGKCLYKQLTDQGLEVTHINDPFMVPEYMAYTLKYDSTFGKAAGVSHKENYLIYGKQKTLVTHEKAPDMIKWDVDIVLEATGVFTTVANAGLHNAPKVLITAPSSDAPMFVYSVNHEKYQNEKVFSCASCTTTCLAPAAQIIDEKYGLIEGLMTTVHAATATQKVVDAASSKDWRSGRGSMQNIIPSSTGAAKAVAKIIPALAGKLTGMAMRVPVANVSVVDLTFRTKKATSLEEIKKDFEEASKTQYKNIMEVTTDQIVSSDVNGSSFSTVLDVKASIALNQNFFKILLWYDNEFGYSSRVVDMIKYIAKK